MPRSEGRRLRRSQRYPPAIGYLRPMDRVIIDPRGRRRVIVGGLLAAFPVPQSVSDWKALFNEYLSQPVPFYQYLPEAMRPKANNLQALMDKAQQWWIDADPDRRSEAIEDTKALLCTLAQVRETLNRMRAAFKVLEARYGDQRNWPPSAQAYVLEFNGLNVRYLQLSAVVYGSAYPIDVKTGLPIMPEGEKPEVVATIKAIRCPVSVFPMTPADGVGSPLVVAGVIAVAIAVVALSVALYPVAKSLLVDAERKAVEVEGDAHVKAAMASTVQDPNASEAQKAAAANVLKDITEKEKQRAKGEGGPGGLDELLAGIGKTVIVTGLALGAGYAALKIAERKLLPAPSGAAA